MGEINPDYPSQGTPASGALIEGYGCTGYTPFGLLISLPSMLAGVLSPKPS